MEVCEQRVKVMSEIFDGNPVAAMVTSYPPFVPPEELVTVIRLRPTSIGLTVESIETVPIGEIITFG